MFHYCSGYRPQGKGDDPDFHEHIGPENEKEPSPPLKELDGGVAAESVWYLPHGSLCRPASLPDRLPSSQTGGCSGVL